MKLMARVGLIATLVLAAISVRADEEVSLDAVPGHVKEAARAAVPGLVLEKAEREVEKGGVIYDLEGTAGGVRYEVEVTAAGKVTEIEKGEETDDGDEDENDNDD